MFTNKKPNWVYQGKSIQQVIEELRTFENSNLKILISIDYGVSRSPISAIEDKNGCFLLLRQKKKPSIEKEDFNEMTINQLIDELEAIKDQELEVRLSLDMDENHKPISRIGKKDGFCLLMSCSEYYDRRHASNS